MSYKYKAFGFIIESPYPILQVEEAAGDAVPDIFVKESALPDVAALDERYYMTSEESVSYNSPVLGAMKISGGNLIEVQCKEGSTDEEFGLLVMGTCMGAIMHQRGLLPIHGSCVTDGKRSVLISGDSGAGKSTLASEFLAHGWKLVTDDVSLIKNISETPVVQSSYPSQKLCPDSMVSYKTEEREYKFLFNIDETQKYAVSVQNTFHEGTAPLSLFVYLRITDDETRVEKASGFDCVHYLQRNTYCKEYLSSDRRNAFFQNIVTLSQKLPMVLAYREDGKQTAGMLYEMITKEL